MGNTADVKGGAAAARSRSKGTTDQLGGGDATRAAGEQASRLPHIWGLCLVRSNNLERSHRLKEAMTAYLPTLRQLQYLVALHDHGHFGRAAQSCFITQSTLSASLRELETLLGSTLVVGRLLGRDRPGPRRTVGVIVAGSWLVHRSAAPCSRQTD